MRNLLLILGIALSCLGLKAQNNLTLHYDKPAEYFEETLLIGNGRLGGIVYGGTKTDRISLNDITLWTGEPNTKSISPEAYKNIPQIREALNSEDYVLADSLARLLQGKNSQKYQPLGTMYIDYIDGSKGEKFQEVSKGSKFQEVSKVSKFQGVSKGSKFQEVSGYGRSLNLSTAVAENHYLRNGKSFSTEYFVSGHDSVIVVRIVSKEKGGINAVVRLETEQPHSLKAEGNRIINNGYVAYECNNYPIDGTHGENFYYDENRGIHFSTIVSAKNKGGKITAEDGKLLLNGCKEVVILIANATSFNGADKDPVREGKDYMTEARRVMDKASAKSYANILKDHIADHQYFFNRVSLNLGETSADIKALTTEQQLLNYTANSQKNPELEALYFQYGRYLLISSSRTPGVPANLQGLWNEYMNAPWRSNYTVNINLEENYWGAETTNLSEMQQSLATFIAAMQRPGRTTAQAFYNVKQGWCAGHNSDIWAMTCPVGEQNENPQWANWAMGGAWLSTHLWEHYTFTQDKTFLENYYPVLKGAAEFGLNWLIEKNGELITMPSTSPENNFVTDKGFAGSFFYGGTADLAILRECITDAVLAAQTLGKDADFQKLANEKLSKLRPYHIGKRGQLLEWYHDWDDQDWHHRHQSHLIGLYPGHQITPLATPDLAKAAARSLEIKGDKTTGWSTGWRVNLFARLLDNKNAYHMVRTLLKYVSPDQYKGEDAHRGGGTYPNLLDAHSPFQIDGNFGGSAGIAEMLMQSSENTITLLPACPSDWSTGEVKGLCARGGFIVDFAWKDSKVTKCSVTARADGETDVIFNGETHHVNLIKGQTENIIK